MGIGERERESQAGRGRGRGVHPSSRAQPSTNMILASLLSLSLTRSDVGGELDWILHNVVDEGVDRIGVERWSAHVELIQDDTCDQIRSDQMGRRCIRSSDHIAENKGPS